MSSNISNIIFIMKLGPSAMPSNVWKESLNIDAHQCHQHHRQSHLILPELSEHTKATRYDIGNPDPGLGQGHKCGRVKPDYEIPFPLLLTGSPTTIHIERIDLISFF